MKKLTGLVIILAVLILGGYYGMGVFTEKTIKKDLEIINQSNGLYADIEEYKKGWFRSYAKIQWKLHIPERVEKDSNGQPQAIPAQDYQVEMPITIYHGPFIFANHKLRFGMGLAESDIKLPKEFSDKFDASFSKDSIKPQLILSIFVNYFNKSTLEISLPHFKLNANDGSGQIDWKGMRSFTSISSQVDRINGKIILDGFNINKDDISISMGKAKTVYDLHLTTSGLYLGDASFSLPSLSMTEKKQKTFEIDKLSIKSSSSIKDSLFGSSLSLSIKSVYANGEAYGPAEFDVSLRNLDADVLAKINEQANAMQSGSDVERQKAMLGMLPELPKLFGKGAEFEISKLQLKLPQGNVEGHLFVSLPKGDVINPFEIYQKIKGDAKLQLPSAIVKMLMQQSVLIRLQKHPELQQTLTQELQQGGSQGNQTATTPEQLAANYADKQLATMQQSGLIAVKDADFYIEINLDQGNFTVNGKPFDPSMFKF